MTIPASTAIPCPEPGCTGTVEDGYCTVTGMAVAPSPAASAPASAGPGSGAPSRGGGSNISASSTSGSITTASGASGSTATRSGGSRSGTTRSGRSSRGRGHLGAGLVEVPPVPARDPAAAVPADPLVPESKRFCGTCERPVGRGRDGQPGLTEGFCPHCGSQLSFTPKLQAGEMVAGQYEVLGCLAHGGLGWIYLARDHHLGLRWVVLKGLLNAGDAAAQEAAVAERGFLAEVDYPTIVGVYNFVQHADRRTGDTAGYIVMEYVGGQSLRQILLDHRRITSESLPLPVALAYAIEVLPALGYLHNRGLVYCDFKPDNVIQTEEQLKIIDMGGVRRIDDPEGAIYGTEGYQAPEISDAGPSPASDVYTVGRSLAVMTFRFTGYQTEFKHRLPDPSAVPLLAKQESFYRALRRSTDPDPDRRFESAVEMAEQLTGVLREVVAVADQQPRPAFSALFSPELRAIGVAATVLDGRAGAGAPRPAPAAAEIVVGLPVPQVDSGDPVAGYLATLDSAQRITALSEAIAGGAGVPPAAADSAETRLALVRELIVSGDLSGPQRVLGDLAVIDPGDWRVAWYTGLRSLTADNPAGARAAFDAVYDALPGELAPKLALAFAAEAAGDHAAAARYFRLVWTVDHAYVSAAFGLARTRLQADDGPGAVAALTAVPDASTHHLAAQVAAVRIQIMARRDQTKAAADDLRAAGGRIGRLKLDAALQEQLTAEVLQAALDSVASGATLAGGELLGCEPSERSLRFGLERSYRALARLAPDRRRRIEVVDLANDVRPRTWA
ncbi:MAG: tetratricopeptide repeat protein [Streptosporangiaceae bacterium]